MVRSQAVTLTRSFADLRHDALAIARAGIRAADAARLTAHALVQGDGSPPLVGGSRPRFSVIAFGKAAPKMAETAAAWVGDRLHAGLAVYPGPSPVPERFEVVIGGHPVPTAESEEAGRRAMALARSLGPDDHLLVLVSGGASALMALPADGVTLDDKRRTTDRLLRAGADIHALNTVRKHLSAIKGGRLAAGTRASLQALVISDVVGDDLSVIASGPTVGDASRFEDALEILRRFGGEDAFPPAVVDRLRRGAAGALDETPKPGDPRLTHAETRVIGSRRDAMDGAVTEARARGYDVVRLDEPVVGEARVAAAAHVRSVLSRPHNPARPACIVSSGETTVHVTGRGKGGRNQEFALAAALTLDTGTGLGVAIASVGTDGIDGPTDAAGAYADSTTIERARAAGLAPGGFLSDNNVYAFFDALGDLIHTGPTGTNVGDLQLILLA